MLAIIVPLEGGGLVDPGYGRPGGGRPPVEVSPPIVIPPGSIDNTLPDNPIPSHPIVIPPRPVDPGYGRPGWSPVDPGWGVGGVPHPGHGLPHPPGHVSPPIVYPPGYPDQGLPPTPGLPPLKPSNPIVLPDLPNVGQGAIVIPLPAATPKPAGVPAGYWSALVVFPGQMPTVAWFAPTATPK